MEVVSNPLPSLIRLVGLTTPQLAVVRQYSARQLWTRSEVLMDGVAPVMDLHHATSTAPSKMIYGRILAQSSGFLLQVFARNSVQPLSSRLSMLNVTRLIQLKLRRPISSKARSLLYFKAINPILG